MVIFMPIPRDQFEKGIDEIEYKILKFLRENRDKAFTSEEIMREVLGNGYVDYI